MAARRSNDDPENAPRDAGPDGYRALFERSADANLVVVGDRFVDCNQATVDMLRYENKAQILRAHPSELSPERQPDGRLSFEKANEMMAIAFQRGSHRFEWEHVRAGGEVFPVEVLLTAVPRGAQTILHVVWRDITERKQLEEELRQAQKMEAIGKLAGGIAHDFNNLLVAVLGHADLLGTKLPDDHDLRCHVDEISRAGKRAAALVGQLLAFSRRQVLQPKVVDLNRVVTETERMLSRIIGEDVDLSLRLHSKPLWVEADPGQIEQVLLNLATNARDAMPSGGVLSVRTAAAGSGDVAANGSRPSGALPWAALVVSDSGTGMDEATLGRVFEPFFTTKEQGKGTGLGLSTAFGIAKQSGGDIRVRSRIGEGTTFELLLPRTRKRPERERPIVPEPRPESPPTARILIVEDEPLVADILVTVLANAGYAVHHAPDGVAALEQVERGDVAYDLLVTDVVMPRMGGPELAERLRKERPGLAVLFVSGYADGARAPRGPLTDDAEFIGKPFLPAELRERVARVLERARQAGPPGVEP